MKRALIVLSGGQDSTTCAYVARQQGYELDAITFNYGQRHERELKAAADVADLVGVRHHELVTLGHGILRSSSPLVSDAPLEQYDNYNALPGGIEKTFVPMRNQLFLTLAVNRAIAAGIHTIFTGVCQEDFGGYPDCRRLFIDSFITTSLHGLYNELNLDKLHIETPLMYRSKADSVRLALDIDGCYEALAFSHTAYDGAYPPVGHDHATLLRAKGFAEANVPDPLIIRAWLEERMMLPMEPNYSQLNVASYIPLVKSAMTKVALNRRERQLAQGRA